MPCSDLEFKEEIGHRAFGTVYMEGLALKKLPIPADSEELDIVSPNKEIAALRIVFNYLNGMSQWSFII